MARTRRTITIDEKIAKAQENVDKAKAKYDAAMAELDALMDKKDEMKRDQLIQAIENSSKSYDDILNFLQTQE